MFPRHLTTVSDGTPPLIYVCLSHSYMQRGNVCSHTSKATGKSTNKKDIIFQNVGGLTGKLSSRGREGEAILGHLKYLSNFGASQKISMTLLHVLDGSPSNFYPFLFGFHTTYNECLSNAHETTQRNRCIKFRGTRDVSMYVYKSLYQHSNKIYTFLYSSECNIYRGQIYHILFHG